MSVSPHYFDVFKIPVVRGRAFDQRDDAAGTRVAIINEVLAREFWPKGDPIGERVLLGKGYGPEFEEPERQIIGVAADVHDFGLNRNPTPMVYVPMAQVTDGITALANRASRIVWMVRTEVSPYSLRSAIRTELEQASGGLPVSHVRSMEEVVSESTARADFNMTLLTLFGAAALVLAVIGIYGLMAYSVRQRTREIGIRLALGAQANHVRNMVVAECDCRWSEWPSVSRLHSASLVCFKASFLACRPGTLWYSSPCRFCWASRLSGQCGSQPGAPPERIRLMHCVKTEPRP
jgi:hypothetical protein